MSGEGFPTRDFRVFWTGEAVSAFGTYLTLLVLQVLVVQTLGGGATEVGWVSAARFAPYLVLGLVVGALVDRARRRPVMVGTDLVRAAVLAIVPIAWSLDALTLPLLLGVVALYGTATLVNAAASQSFLPRLVPAGRLHPAHARLDGTDALAQTTGPVLAGVLIALVGAPLALLVDAATYLVAAGCVALLSVAEPPARREPRRRGRLREEVVAGVRWVYGESGLRALAVGTHVWFAGNAVLTTVLAPFALLVLGLSPLQLGVAVAGAGLGAVAGAALSGRVGRRLGTGGAVIAAHAVTVVGVVVMACAGLGTSGWSTTVVLGLGQMLHGLAMGSSNAHEMSYRQRLTPDEFQARTNTTLHSLNRAVFVAVAPLAGILADAAGARSALAVSAALFTVAVLVLATSTFRHARPA